MANFFYVKEGLGTRAAATDTGFTDFETGAFGSGNLVAAAVYASIGDACSATKSNPPIDGDFVLVSSAHTKAYDNGAHVLINSAGAKNGSGLQVISVDDSNAENYLPGASEELNDGLDDYRLYNNALIAGVDLENDNDVIRPVTVGGHIVVQDCTLTVSTGATDTAFTAVVDGNVMKAINVDVIFAAATNLLSTLGYGGALVMDGGSLGGTVLTKLLEGVNFGRDGGATVILNGVDLSNQSGTILSATDAAAADSLLVRLNNCRTHASVTLYGTLSSVNHRFEIFNTDDADFYRFEVADGAGSAKNNDTVYVTAGETWYEGTDHSSIQVDTTALCSRAAPFVFELPAKYVNLAEGTTDTLTIEMVTEETLNAQDMAAFLVYPDGTTAVLPRWKSSGPSVGTGNYGIDPLDSTTAMGASTLTTSDWTEALTGETYYGLILDTSGVAGQATAVSIRIEVYKASIGPIYIHPLITVSAT